MAQAAEQREDRRWRSLHVRGVQRGDVGQDLRPTGH